MLDLSENAYIEKIWFIDAMREHGVDFLAALSRPLEGGPWKIVYRFRYGTLGSDMSQDKKSWYEVKPRGKSLEVLLAGFEVMLQVVSTRYPGKRYDIVVQGDGLRARQLLAEQPWSHFTFTKLQGSA